jgi:hypothetical protein
MNTRDTDKLLADRDALTPLNMVHYARQVCGMPKKGEEKAMSRVFDHPNMNGEWRCPICLTNDDAPVVLIPINGTNTDNKFNYTAKQVHHRCLLDNLVIYGNRISAMTEEV